MGGRERTFGLALLFDLSDSETRRVIQEDALSDDNVAQMTTGPSKYKLRLSFGNANGEFDMEPRRLEGIALKNIRYLYKAKGPP
jgi:hypothetical protein